MKTTHIILAAALAATSAMQAANAEHKLPAPMPGFMSQEQLTKWQADRIAKAQAKKAAETAVTQAISALTEGASVFYTGKPYIEETGSYTFKFRQYDRELSRWTTSDPSGFPDGANNLSYAPIATCEIDYQGLQAHRTFGGTMHNITLTVGVYDPTNTITQNTLNDWKDAVIDAWAYTGTDKSNQRSLGMTTYITFTFIMGTYDQATALNSYDNVVTFRNSPNYNTVSDWRVGLWDYGISSSLVVHETGHFMQAPDKYDEISPLPNRVTQPKPGWAGTIMGAGSTPATKLDANLVLQSLGENTHLFE